MSTTLPATAPDAKPQTLDELMLAMDVVDTLRHQDSLVERELDETRREADLIERLREIYKNQGIEVSDEVIRQGVAAIKEDRFAYTPPKPGLGVTLARVWIARGKIGGTLGILAVVAGLATGGWWFGVEQPRRAEAARIEREVKEIIPRGLEAGHKEAMAEAKVESARTKANQILADGQAALRRGDAAGGRKAITDLEGLRATLLQEYWLRIFARPNELSALWRVPRNNPNARVYYVIVEAVAPDGKILSLPVVHEPTDEVSTVTRFGIRISAETFQQIVRDKTDDGLIQNNRVGEKKRGELEVTYVMPVLSGTITPVTRQGKTEWDHNVR